MNSPQTEIIWIIDWCTNDFLIEWLSCLCDKSETEYITVSETKTHMISASAT